MAAKSTPKTPRDPEGRKRAIVQAAAELIMELGISNITHRKIAERAGVPLGSTTQYFATLDDLRHAAIAFLSEDDARNIERTSDRNQYSACLGTPIGAVSQRPIPSSVRNPVLPCARRTFPTTTD